MRNAHGATGGKTRCFVGSPFGFLFDAGGVSIFQRGLSRMFWLVYMRLWMGGPWVKMLSCLLGMPR